MDKSSLHSYLHEVGFPPNLVFKGNNFTNIQGAKISHRLAKDDLTMTLLYFETRL